MAKTISAPRTELSKYAPRIEIVKINPEKIGALIGPGGKNIKKLVEESGCEIDIEDDGTVNIFSVSAEGMKIAKDAIVGMSAEAEIGKIYRGKVVTVKEFGAFVEFLPGKDGLVHISELANFRVKKTEDIVKVGDDITVKCLGVDEKGRVRLSRKAAMEDRDKEAAGEAQPAAAAGNNPLEQFKARTGNRSRFFVFRAGLKKSAVKRDGPVFFSSDPVKVAGDERTIMAQRDAGTQLAGRGMSREEREGCEEGNWHPPLCLCASVANRPFL